MSAHPQGSQFGFSRPVAEALALSAVVAAVLVLLSSWGGRYPLAAEMVRMATVVAALLAFALRHRAELRAERASRRAAERDRDAHALRLDQLSAEALFSGHLHPMCSHCKSIRDAGGNWLPIEAYLEHFLQAAFSHGVCPECLRVEYPGLFSDLTGS